MCFVSFTVESPGANLHILVPIGAVLGGLLVLVLLFSVCAFVCYKLRTGNCVLNMYLASSTRKTDQYV